MPSGLNGQNKIILLSLLVLGLSSYVFLNNNNSVNLKAENDLSVRSIKDGVIIPSYKWLNYGPQINVGDKEESDGIRASAVLSDGSMALVGTWYHGLWLKDKAGWQNLQNTSPVGIVRHILIPPGKIAVKAGEKIIFVIVADNGIQIVKKSDKYEVQSFLLPVDKTSVSFLQTGAFLSSGELLLGGSGGIIKAKNWERGLNNLEPLFYALEPTEGTENIMIRTLAVNPKNTNEIYAAGWWGYSGWERGIDGQIKPGAGVWKSISSGKMGTWKQVALGGININCLWVSPNNPAVVVAGAEGAGDQSTRKPDGAHHSLYISLDSGANWNPLTPRPWIYDLVAPQSAFVFDKKTEILYISFWGGPVMSVYLPSEVNLTDLNSLRWTFLGSQSDKKDFVGGHLSLTETNSGMNLVTGSMDYWTRPLKKYTPLYLLKVPKGRSELY